MLSGYFKTMSNDETEHPKNESMQFTEINHDYIYKLKEELDLSLSKVVNMLITESKNR
jgi:hypothetical protein|tara:strand:- start:160 stop:333 length:174 start_codon:yes stop_codon:yes gene_type:complete